mmetsp:Transcript_13984/g.33829  ORF Transcript_13984/g.33829 Transcript_13984/m.33829 type:complete len:220 (-) Transcript_13984:1095-1754(-)
MISRRRGARLMESSDSTNASSTIATIWQVYALVDATPISAPALMCTPQSVPRLMADPTVLTMPTHSAPRSLAYCIALRVSAVSPDWLMKMQVSSRKKGHCRSSTSEASSRVTGSSVSSSISCRTAIAEWYDVPHPQSMMRRERRMVLTKFTMPPRKTRSTTWPHALSTMRPRIPCVMASGCSWISFCMKWSKFPFMICSTSIAKVSTARSTSALCTVGS